MKKNKYFDKAEKMYVEQFITEVGVAKRLGISDRTVRRWKADGNWCEKRKEFLKKQTLTNYDMYQLVRQMLDDFNEDLANKQQIDVSRLNKFLNITEEMVKPKTKKLTLEELLNIAIKNKMPKKLSLMMTKNGILIFKFKPFIALKSLFGNIHSHKLNSTERLLNTF